MSWIGLEQKLVLSLPGALAGVMAVARCGWGPIAGLVEASRAGREETGRI